MTKKLKITSEVASPNEAHIAGGCLLPASVAWPADSDGNALLHLLTIPLNWVTANTNGWASIFVPYYLSDTFLHWEDLTIDDKNQSVVIVHNNDGLHRNEYPKEFSAAKKILLEENNEADSDKNFESKIYGVPAWLQDIDEKTGYQCVLAINGDDVDIGFPEEPGIFSDGVVYVFLKDGFQACTQPSTQGMVTFQFT